MSRLYWHWACDRVSRVEGQSLQQRDACSCFLPDAVIESRFSNDFSVMWESWKIVQQQSSRASSQIYSTVSGVFLVNGYPEDFSSWTDNRPAYKSSWHSKQICVLSKEYSTIARGSISRVSIADLLSLARSLMQARCSNLLAMKIAERSRYKPQNCVHKVSTCRQYDSKWQTESVGFGVISVPCVFVE